MGDTDSANDPELQVKKLQDLVKKLERQNEQLRNKTNLDEIGMETTNSSATEISKLSRSNSETFTKDVMNLSLDTVDEIQVDTFVDGDEDTWLYSSPAKPPTPEQRKVSPYKWARQDFDNPTSDMEKARRSLYARLEEVTRLSRNFSPFSSPVSSSKPIVVSPTKPPEVNPVQSSSQMSSIALKGGGEGGELAVNRSPRGEVAVNRSPRKERHVLPDEERIGMSKLEDVTDVQIIARMQEESLRRASLRSLTPPPRRRISLPSGANSGLRQSTQNSSPSSSPRRAHPQSPQQLHQQQLYQQQQQQQQQQLYHQQQKQQLYQQQQQMHHQQQIHQQQQRQHRAHTQKALSPRQRQYENEFVGEDYEHEQNTVVFRRRPSLERVKKNPDGDVKRYSLGASLSNHHAITPDDLANLNIADQHNRQRSSHSGGGRRQPPSPPPTATSHPPSPPQPAQYHPPIPPPHAHPQLYLQHEENHIHDSRLRQPSHVSHLKAPSPTKLRTSSPHRSGIPVRSGELSPQRSSSLPRPVSSHGNLHKSRKGQPTNHSRSTSIPRQAANANRIRDETWKEGCF
ncbi:uncharacterized protein LOC102804587 [Saccoglossus kowalevskii]|uniref:Bromodomain-containing protein DDB_G0280777-like n=1 Tax=Saccoglossus kowalevskii TaxID=10224 RepID=A0ABM0M5J7_SACKO|nr:PREDICTED: bromodomain-containing protein DDB_G0280777-like [Saccoglossus kowalevskii]